MNIKGLDVPTGPMFATENHEATEYVMYGINCDRKFPFINNVKL